MAEKTYIALSGGFDPLHHGHVAMINHAAQFGEVLIFLNSDEWLKNKKSYVFMDYEQRKNVLMGLKGVSRVILAQDADGTVVSSITSHAPIIKAFGNGGDRGTGNTPECQICQRLEIPMIFGLGGNVPVHSSDLVKNVKANSLCI